MAKTGKNKIGSTSKADSAKPTRKLLKKEKRKLRAEADAARFQRTDADSWGDGTKRVSPEDKATHIVPPKKTAQRDAGITKQDLSPNSTAAEQGKRSSADGTQTSSVTNMLAAQASILLSIAAGIGILLGFAALGLPGGREAVPTIGGVLYSVAPIETARIVLALDTLFPVFYGAGLAVLATSFKTRGNRPLVRLILTTLLVVVVADFSENALAFGVMAGEPISPFMFPLTVIKYASIAFASVMLSSVAPRDGGFGWVVHILLRYIFPVLIALLIAGVGGNVVREIVGASFPVSLLLLALYAGDQA